MKKNDKTSMLYILQRKSFIRIGDLTILSIRRRTENTPTIERMIGWKKVKIVILMSFFIYNFYLHTQTHTANTYVHIAIALTSCYFIENILLYFQFHTFMLYIVLRCDVELNGKCKKNCVTKSKRRSDCTLKEKLLM